MSTRPFTNTSRRSTTRHQKLYGSQAWRKASAAFLAKHRICIDCKARGRIVASEVTDHIIPHNGDLELFWQSSNWAARCWGCHSSKTRHDDAEAKSGRVRLRPGCTVTGEPLDPRHPWHQERGS